jgi:negative regulator of flagellin synthesis FlgM
MSYASGIGSLQLGIDSIAPSEPKAAVQSQANTGSDNESLIENISHTDQAKLSTAGGLVAQALNGSDVRSEKIASLQQAIAAGTYSVSSSDVANKVLQSLLD